MKPDWAKDGIELYCGDCLQVLPQLQDGLAHSVITDPPYNCGKPYDGYDDSRPDEEFAEWLSSALGWASRKCNTGSVVWFPGVKNLFNSHGLCQSAGLEVWRVLGWHKREFAGDKLSGGPAYSWEPVIWARRPGESVWRKRTGHDGRDFCVVNYTHGDPDADLHPCPKPIKVMNWLVRMVTADSEVVLDPFMGTARTGVACVLNGRRFIGIEQSPKYFERACRRIEQAFENIGLYA
jgi:site-specific DNA-methyltransferase (adenine-specific)